VTALRLILRSLRYFRASHAALAAGAALVTAVLAGAMILGDSVNDSLSDVSRRSRGDFDSMVVAPSFFSQSLAGRVEGMSGTRCVAGLMLPGRARAERTSLSTGVQLLAMPALADVPRGGAWIARSLADDLGVASGDALLVTLPTPASAAVLSRRDRAAALGSLRLIVARVLDDRTDDRAEAFLSWFSPHPSQRAPANVWLNDAELAEAIFADVPTQQRIPQSPANVMLMRGSGDIPAGAMTLEDYGVGLRAIDDRWVVQPGGVYLPPYLSRCAGAEAVDVMLLDTLAGEGGGRLNYVLAAGIDGELKLGPDEAAVNQWTADQLHVQIGDALHATAYVLQGDGSIATGAAHELRLAAILPMTGIGADASLTPTFHGLTDADTMSDWHPPMGFPFDRKRVTLADEAYWKQYRAAPKVFVNLTTAQEIAGNAETTSLRFAAGQGDPTARLLAGLSPRDAGLIPNSLARAQVGGSDFGQLFLGLSAFVLIAALLLVTLLFRLAVEQRRRQMGLLMALGFGPARVARLILAEGTVVAAMGAVMGIPLALVYTRLLVHGLATWWIGATQTQAIALHVRGSTLAGGAAASFLAATIALAVTAWGMGKATPLAQLHGGESPVVLRRKGRGTSTAVIGGGGIVLAISPLILAGAGRMNGSAGFLLSGFVLLCLGMLLLARLPATSRRARESLARIAAASVLRQRTAALLCVGLMSAATFLLLSVTAFESGGDSRTAPPSPTGGYQLIVSTQIPLPADLQTRAGRRLLGVPDDAVFESARFTPLLVAAGNDLSCRNMTRPAQATVVGVPMTVLNRLLVSRRRAPERAIAAGSIGAAVDEESAEYILHLQLGDRLPAPMANRPIVIDALLSDSMFQGEALVSDGDFRIAFPGIRRPAMVLVECPESAVDSLQRLLRTGLDDFGVTVQTPAQRLAGYHAVADSYISAFQMLGALGLLVGAVGLMVVLARNVIQRRAELALLRAIGFSSRRLMEMLVIEHGLLLGGGLMLGAATSLVAMLPRIRQVNLLPVALAMAMILGCGLAALMIAALLATRRLTPAALRQE
jgi:ABC-type antimicrobial peptide transport system permease subunit